MTLYLLPNLLSQTEAAPPLGGIQRNFLATLAPIMSTLDGLIAESEGEGRRYLKRFQLKKDPYAIPIALLNKKTGNKDLDFLLSPMVKGETWGLISDTGLPCLADPGSHLVLRAQQRRIPTQALFGPSSIFLALMLSGLQGQHFFFHGYLPKEPLERQRALKKWEAMEAVTHLFIEAPYRNQHTFKACLQTLRKDTLLSVAYNLLALDQFVHTAPVGEWEERPWGKQPMVFLFYSMGRKR